MDNLFFFIYKKIKAHKTASLLLLFIVIGILSFIASKIEFEEDITKLIPTNSQNAEAQKVLQTVNFADKIIVHIQRDSNGSLDDLSLLASQFTDSVSKNNNHYIKKIQGKVKDEDLSQTLDFVYKNLPLFLDEKDYEQISQKINADSILAINQSNYKTLVSPTGFIAKKTILKDPLGLSFIAIKKLKQLGFGDDFTLHNGFLLSKDKNSILLFMTPSLETSETSENTFFVEQLYNLKSKLNNQFKGKAQLSYFGGVFIAVANAQQIKHDIQFTISIAVTILLLILIFFYRKITIPIILFIPTLFGGLLAVGVLFLIRTQISAISLGIGSVLLGVTLDYSLHILTHIRSNNKVKSLFTEITKPILMSSLTTALAFLCLLFLKSQALQDLGIFAAISVLGASIFALLFIPQVYKEKKEYKKNTIIDVIASYPIDKNRWVIVLLSILILGSLFTYQKVTFNKDLAKLNFEPQEIIKAREQLDLLTNINSKSVYIASYHNQKEIALQTNDTIYKQLKKLKNKIIDFSSIGSIIYSQKKQKKQIKKWESFWNQELKNKLQKNLIESGNTLGFKPSTYQSFYSFLNQTFHPIGIDDYRVLKSLSIDDYITTKNNLTTITTLIKVPENKTQPIVKTFKNKPNTLLIDRKEMNETFLGNLKTDFNHLIMYSLIVVTIILLLFYKSFSLTLVTAIPICLSWILTIGIMGFFEIQFNIFNIIISSFIFGLGVDYSIFMTNGLLHEYKTGKKTLSTHKTSIILSVITTMLGVGVLIFAKHPALYSISLVSVVGILAAVLISFTLQPQLFKLFIGSTSKRPITLRLLIHSLLSFAYYGLGGILLSIFSVSFMKIIPLKKKVKMKWFHIITSKFMGSVLYSNPFVKKTIINEVNENFKTPSVIIANHTSFLDILVIGMLHPKIIFLVNDWVYNSPIFGKAVQLAGFYPVSSGIEKGVSHLQKKIEQGYSLMSFPEGTRSTTNKIKRFHKGAFYLAEQFNLDILPILIHGNSEVLPKGSFIIKNGSITVKILDRIKASDTRFGENYSKKGKQIGAFYREQFQKLRNQIEDENYFIPIILEEYRYKGDTIYQKVKSELQKNKTSYKSICNILPKKETILHLTKNSGQLVFLLTLDSADRNISTFIENEEERALFKNSFLTHKHPKIKVIQQCPYLLSNSSFTSLLININTLNQRDFEKLIHPQLETLIFWKENNNISINYVVNNGYINTYEDQKILILKKRIQEKE